MERENSLIEVKNLFNESRYFRPNPIASKPLSERAGAIKFFQDEKFKHEDGTLFTGKDLGIRCSHLRLDHLYHIMSVYKDKKHRDGKGEAEWYFMGATKTKKVLGNGITNKDK